MFDAMCDFYIHFFLFLKLGETSVMVTAVSKTKPSPSQFMPLVVRPLTSLCGVYRAHSEGFFLSSCYICMECKRISWLSGEWMSALINRWTTDRKQLLQVESPPTIWGESWAPPTTRSSPADSSVSWYECVFLYVQLWCSRSAYWCSVNALDLSTLYNSSSCLCCSDRSIRPLFPSGYFYDTQVSSVWNWFHRYVVIVLPSFCFFEQRWY